MTPDRTRIPKPLVLYSIAFVMIALAVHKPWLSPLSLSVLLAGSIWLWMLERRSVRDLGIHFISSWRNYACLGIFIGFTFPSILTIMENASGWITIVWGPNSIVNSNSITSSLIAVIKIALVVAVEEVVFRGYFLQQFSLNLKTSKAMFLSSLLWALLHLPNMVNSGMSAVFVAMGIVTFTVLGVALSVGFLEAESTLWFPFGLHFGYNLSYSLIGIFAAVTFNAPVWLVGHQAWAPESGLLGLILSIIIFITAKFTVKWI